MSIETKFKLYVLTERLYGRLSTSANKVEAFIKKIISQLLSLQCHSVVMVKRDDIKAEVHNAVREYVDQLISERHAPGRGMAVSAHDLMVAARSAGHRGITHCTCHFIIIDPHSCNH